MKSFNRSGSNRYDMTFPDNYVTNAKNEGISCSRVKMEGYHGII